MPLQCPRCSRTIEFSGERPRFCAYCGSALSEIDETSPRVVVGTADETREYVPPTRRNEEETWPDRIATFDLVRLLGKGGMGAVFEAKEDGTGRRVALKLIAHDRISSPEALERFRQEGRLASTVSHPRCVFVLAADEADGRPYIVMELMPGTTLQDLVERDGPMSAEQAVPRMIDVIDGLIEAHGLGVIHRDVKPSNCFVDDDGRTKIGDFGLSKSLSGGSNLTRTGAFLGTPLYASPEQIRGESIDERTDVYSVAATLYYLLAGRPPFEGTDAAATLARIVSEPLPPLRSFRPDVPVELESIIHRGMARDKTRRHRSLAEFRQALGPFSPGRLVPATPGRRVAAFLLDTYGPAIVVDLLLQFLFLLATRGRQWPSSTLLERADLLTEVLVVVFSFLIVESLSGASPGKWLMGLRVWGEGAAPATYRQIWRRTLVFFLVAAAPRWIWSFAVQRFEVDPNLQVAIGMVWSSAPLLLFIPTSRASGFLGLHERLSKTRVVRLPRLTRRRAPVRRRPVGKGHHGVTRPAGVLRAIGPYEVRGAVKWDPERKVLAVEDPALQRECWVVMRPKGAAPPAAESRELARDTRPRWLGGGEQGENRWDAYTAPGGCSLADLAGASGLAWADARPLLEDLAGELAEAASDGTLPESLDVGMVWVEPDGTAILVDPLATPGRTDRRPPADRALDLLRQSAALALEGGRHERERQGRPIRSAVPIHARQVLDRLIGGPNAYTEPGAFRDDLIAKRDEVTEVDRTSRALHLAVQAIALFPGLSACLGVALFFLTGVYREESAVTEQEWNALGYAGIEEWARDAAPAVGVTAGLVALAWVVCGALTSGGLTMRLAGLALVRRDGRPASRWRCGLRALLVWAPFASLMGLSSWALAGGSGSPWLAWTFFAAAVLLLTAYVPLALKRPDRGPHDRLVGTLIVPR